ncbi:MAG: hypothetical protein KatS3mg102_0185 [Planctomycetota bacterium]|nr:MAG: hypothetical protein KatS3mg102_0185 [Planctomycetota bacterium]
MSGPLAPWLAELERWLARAAQTLVPAAAARARLEADLERLRAREHQLEAPLVLVLTGGTGAGKSTLLNALAGAAICRTGVVRPTTRELTTYHHLEDRLTLPPELQRLGRLVEHDRAALRHKAVVDAPDLDSMELDNRARLAQALAVADVVAVVASPEKYADRELFELLARYRGERAFVFVLNRLDLGIPPEVVEDFRRELEAAGFSRPRLFCLSALAAARATSGEEPDAGPRGEFPQLQAFLERELTRTRIRRIKRANLLQLAAALLARAAGLLPAELAGRLARLQPAAAAVAHAAGAQLGERLARAVRADAELRHELATAHAVCVGGPVGFWQALLWGVRGLVAPAGRRASAAGFGSAAGGARAAGASSAALAGDWEGAREAEAQALVLASARIAALARDEGLLLEPAARLEPEQAHALVREQELRAERACAAAVQAARARPDALAGTLANLPPLAIAGYALWRWLEAALGGAALPPAWFGGTLLLALLAMALAGRALDAVAHRRAARAVEQLASGSASAAAAAVVDRLGAPLEHTAAQARELERGLERLRSELLQLERAAEPEPLLSCPVAALASRTG